MLQALPVPHDILEFAGLSGVAGDTLQRGWLFWRCHLYAALLFRRSVSTRLPLPQEIYVKYRFIYLFECYSIPPRAASGIQRRCLASTFRLRVPGAAGYTVNTYIVYI